MSTSSSAAAPVEEPVVASSTTKKEVEEHTVTVETTVAQEGEETVIVSPNVDKTTEELESSLKLNLLGVITDQAMDQAKEDVETGTPAEPTSPAAHARLEGEHSMSQSWMVPGKAAHEHDDREVQLYATGHIDRRLKRPVYEMPEADVVRKMKAGPTHIQTLSQFKRGPKFTMGVKIKFGDPMAVDEYKGPAPGTYNVKDTANSKVKGFPHISFGKGRRFPKRLGDTPAPGEYEPGQLSSSYRVTFGNAPRDKKDHKHREPGPGTYEFRSTVGHGPRFTARGRKALQKSVSDSSIPGPGAYSIPQAFSSIKCGFGTSTRDVAGRIAGQGRQGYPGPGAYNLPGTFATPKVTVTGRPVSHNIETFLTPGPGQYNVHTSGFGY
ncbi:unnamed protein product [Amoebophrya sp. A120]|nr:unnamed protein product [Amoebophrya sp. A120]|eukprot:GSA120T00006350001.1